MIWLDSTFVAVELNSFFPFRRPKFDKRVGVTNELDSFFFVVAYLEEDGVICVKVTWWSLIVSLVPLVSSTDGSVSAYDDRFGLVILACSSKDVDC